MAEDVQVPQERIDARPDPVPDGQWTAESSGRADAWERAGETRDMTELVALGLVEGD